MIIWIRGLLKIHWMILNGLETFFKIVWHCISSPRMCLLWNGEALAEFHPLRGIRQGNLISPYLFVLYIERLFQLIQIVVDKKSWKPIQITIGAPKLSHLAFVDDFIIFTRALKDQVQVISAFWTCLLIAWVKSLVWTKIVYFSQVMFVGRGKII